MTYVPGSIWGSGADESQYPPRLVWNVPNIASNAPPQQIGYAVTLGEDLSLGATITNNATLSNTYGLVKSDIVTVTITLPDISITPLAFSVTLDRSETTTRTLTIQNLGNLDLSWTLTEQVDAPWLDQTPTTGTVAPSTSTGVTLIFDSADLAAGVYTTTLQIDSNDPDTPRGSVPITLTVQVPDITLTPQALSAALPLGQVTTQTLTIGNIGDADLDWTLTEQTAVDWLTQMPTAGTIGPLGSTNVQVAFDSADLAAGVYTTTLRIESNDPDTPRLDVPITLTVLAPDITLAPHRLTETLQSGETSNRELSVRNIGTADLNWTLTERVEAPWLASSPTNGTLFPSSDTKINVTFDAVGLAAGIYTTTLQIESNDPYKPYIDVPVTLTVGQPFLSLHKTAQRDPVAPGERLTYTLHITNEGLPAHDLVVSDVLPNDTTFAGCDGAACQLEDGAVMWGPLELSGPGQTLNLTMVVTVSTALTNDWPIVNAVYGLQASNAPPLVGAPLTTTVSLPILHLTKWAFLKEVYAGSRLNYTLLVQNSGGRASQLIVSDTLPAGTTFTGCDCSLARLHDASTGQESSFCGTPFTCGLKGDQAVWYLDEIIGGRALQLTLWTTVSTELTEGTIITNDDYIAVAQGLPPVIGQPTVTTTVRQLLLDVQKSAWPNPVALDEPLTFTITVHNSGTLLQNVTVTDLLPSNVSFLDCDGTLCEIAKNGKPEVRWWLGDLPPNSEREVNVRVKLNDVHSDTLINALYGAWIPAVGRLIQGEPVVVRVLDHYLHLPIVLVDF